MSTNYNNERNPLESNKLNDYKNNHQIKINNKKIKTTNNTEYIENKSHFNIRPNYEEEDNYDYEIYNETPYLTFSKLFKSDQNEELKFQTLSNRYNPKKGNEYLYNKENILNNGNSNFNLTFNNGFAKKTYSLNKSEDSTFFNFVEIFEQINQKSQKLFKIQKNTYSSKTNDNRRYISKFSKNKNNIINRSGIGQKKITLYITNGKNVYKTSIKSDKLTNNSMSSFRNRNSKESELPKLLKKNEVKELSKTLYNQANNNYVSISNSSNDTTKTHTNRNISIQANNLNGATTTGFITKGIRSKYKNMKINQKKYINEHKMENDRIQTVAKVETDNKYYRNIPIPDIIKTSPNKTQSNLRESNAIKSYQSGNTSIYQSEIVNKKNETKNRVYEKKNLLSSQQSNNIIDKIELKKKIINRTSSFSLSNKKRVSQNNNNQSVVSPRINNQNIKLLNITSTGDNFNKNKKEILGGETKNIAKKSVIININDDVPYEKKNIGKNEKYQVKNDINNKNDKSNIKSSVVVYSRRNDKVYESKRTNKEEKNNKTKGVKNISIIVNSRNSFQKNNTKNGKDSKIESKK